MLLVHGVIHLRYLESAMTAARNTENTTKPSVTLKGAD